MLDRRQRSAAGTRPPVACPAKPVVRRSDRRRRDGTRANVLAIAPARNLMRLSYVVLVIADISGYTDFITNREISLLHAEQIITELLESLVDRTQHPLTLNKFEGDAALLYSEAGENRSAAVRDVLGQVGAFFGAFSQQLETIKHARAHCNCNA